MGEDIAFEAWLRPEGEQGTRPSRRLRRNGFIPAVLYGKPIGDETVPIKISAKELSRHFPDRFPPIGTKVRLRLHTDEGEKEFQTVIQEVQMHPLRLNPIHIDFLVTS